ncbi:hypothetical protein BSL78_19020 [Apostichopus japonicus]|uniref:MULE transposase domain-containing protein n=1 Tax=Stichopus japonicus TaxID=307972 RepID=A0A2G8K831_STIJA|nr:hypothetical protein BSL78_19020 [Apostichopus japonicus]
MCYLGLIIKRVALAEDRTRQIVATGVNDLSGQAAALMPSVQTISRDIRRQRQHDAPLVPGRNDRNFVIPHDFTIINGMPFLRYDNERNDRMLIFGSEASLGFLAQSQHWFMDGSFQTSPPQFAQLYTIHGLGGGRNVVGAYALLPNKRQDTYVEMLLQLQLQQMTNNASPTSVLTDFELGAIGAVRTVHPNAARKGCLFHLSQSVYRRVQASGLQEAYLNDDAFRSSVRMLPALAFVPLPDVENAFLAVSAIWGARGREIVDYFESTYIGQMRAGRREDPLFSNAVWNVSDRMENDLPRTNNALEGWTTHFRNPLHARVHRYGHSLSPKAGNDGSLVDSPDRSWTTACTTEASLSKDQ